MGLKTLEILSHGAGQNRLFVPPCPAGQRAGRDSRNPLILNVSRRGKHRDKATSCPEIAPFPLLREEGSGTRPGQKREECCHER